MGDLQVFAMPGPTGDVSECSGSWTIAQGIQGPRRLQLKPGDATGAAQAVRHTHPDLVEHRAAEIPRDRLIDGPGSLCCCTEVDTFRPLRPGRHDRRCGNVPNLIGHEPRRRPLHGIGHVVVSRVDCNLQQRQWCRSGHQQSRDGGERFGTVFNAGQAGCRG